MFVKNAISWFGQRLFGAKEPAITRQLLMPLLFLASVSTTLTQLKNYLTRCTAEQKLFVVPQEIRDKVAKHRLILVLDLDETLIYSRQPTPPTNHSNFFTVKVHRKVMQSTDGSFIFVQPRPHVAEFLAAASSVFTLYVYTAGRKAYADAILDVLDPQRLIKKRFYRDSCVPKNRSFVKNLKKLPNDGHMYLLDDNADSVRINSPNAMLIKAFEGEQHDRELSATFEKLLDLYRC